jgi:hypothetical protein
MPSRFARKLSGILFHCKIGVGIGIETGYLIPLINIELAVFAAA